MNWQNRLWIEGYDSRLVPYVPFEIGRLSMESDRVVFVHHHPTGPKKILVTPDESAVERSAGKPTGVALGPGTSSTAEVLALIEPLPFRRGWYLVSQYFYLDWLRELTVWSTPTEVAWPFELTVRGDDPDEMIYIQGPFGGQGPDPDQMIAAGMQSVATGQLQAGAYTLQWLELAYDHAGEPWRQRRYWIRLHEGTFLLTSQARQQNAVKLFALADRVGCSVRYRAPEYNR